MSVVEPIPRPAPGFYMLRAEHAPRDRFEVLSVGTCREEDWWIGSGGATWTRLYVECQDWSRYERLDAPPPHLGLPPVPRSPEALAQAVLDDPRALAALARLLREPARADARAALGVEAAVPAAVLPHRTRHLLVVVTPDGDFRFVGRFDGPRTVLSKGAARVYEQRSLAELGARSMERGQRVEYGVGREPAYVVLDVVVPTWNESCARAAAKGPYNGPHEPESTP